MVVIIVLAFAAALGTLGGLFLGMPMVGYALWPLTRAACRAANIEINPHDEHDPVMQVEGSLAAGLGMALGVFAAVTAVGLALALVPGSHVSVLLVLRAAGAAAASTGLLFGSLWRFGYRGESVMPQLSATALLAGLTTSMMMW